MLLGEENYGKNVQIFFQCSQGWWPAADGEVERKFLWEKKKTKKGKAFLGSEWGRPVCLCVYVGEYK